MVAAIGNAMEPTIRDGDALVIDRNARAFADAVYAAEGLVPVSPDERPSP